MKRVCYVVTGAAGTIGSAISRRLARGDVANRLILVDTAETPLFYLMEELRPIMKANDVLARAINASVLDWPMMRMLMSTLDAEAVIHAAAMKHVGMCDANLRQAIQTNIRGTDVMAEAAESAGAAFVMVSTDKAVKPTTVMGQTKRVAEKLTLMRSRGVVVRLVNVRGSQGSLLPLIQKQIEAGGPINLTHPDMVRHFMSAEDAAALAIDAARAPPGMIYMPKAAKSERIADVIAEAIRASGKTIRVEVVGMRPGEKLVEDLIGPDEVVGINSDAVVTLKPPQTQPSADWLSRVTELWMLNVDNPRETLAELAA